MLQIWRLLFGVCPKKHKGRPLKGVGLTKVSAKELLEEHAQLGVFLHGNNNARLVIDGLAPKCPIEMKPSALGLTYCDYSLQWALTKCLVRS